MGRTVGRPGDRRGGGAHGGAALGRQRSDAGRDKRIALDASADGGAAGDAEAAAAERNLAGWLRQAEAGSGSAVAGIRTGWAGDPDGRGTATRSRIRDDDGARSFLLGSAFHLSLAAGARRGASRLRRCGAGGRPHAASTGEDGGASRWRATSPPRFLGADVEPGAGPRWRA